jgi:branched-chain amino acid transport system ATP-binding protein
LAFLTLEDVTVSYGTLVAVEGINIEVAKNSCVGILGPNGAGKSSMLRAISGSARFTGRIEMDGRIVRGGPEKIARSGIAHVLEGRHIFSRLSVRENLELARFGSTDNRFQERMDWVLEYFPVLREKLRHSGTALSGGQQQILAIARALLMGPKVLLLDEPSLGLAPIVIEQLMLSLPEIMRDWDVTVILAEQFVEFVAAVSSEVHVIRNGRIQYSGSTSDPRFELKVLDQYLGSSGSGASPSASA